MKKFPHVGSRLSAGRRVIRTISAVMLSLGLAFGIIACGGSENPGGSEVTGTSGQAPAGTPPAQPTGTLRVALPEAAASLDPSGPGALEKLPIESALFDGLLRRDPAKPEQPLAPALATAWKTNSDATKWTFTLREGVKFSDGTPFDAAAAKKTFEYFMRPSSAWAFATGPSPKVTTPDDHTLVISYKQPFADLASYMPWIKMISPKSLTGPTPEVEKRVAARPVGTGPFILDSYSSKGTVVHANSDYWGDGPHVEKIEFRPLPEESARNAALQAGDVDLELGVTPRSAQSLRSDPRLKVVTFPSWTVASMGIATYRKPFDDVRVRRALAHAFDAKLIAQKVLLGHATVTGSLMPTGTYGYHVPEARYSYDPAEAKRLLAEAGVEQPVSVSMAGFTDDPNGGAVGQAIVEQAKAAGFNVTFTQVSPAVGQADAYKPNRKYTIYVSQGGYLNGGPIFLTSGIITKQAGYRGKKLLDLIAQVNKAANGPKREQLIGEMLEEAVRELPAVPMYELKQSYASVKELEGYIPPLDGYNPSWVETYFAR